MPLKKTGAYQSIDIRFSYGFSSDFVTEGAQVHLALAFNPSHLEIVSPVVIGSVRARLDRLDEPRVHLQVSNRPDFRCF